MKKIAGYIEKYTGLKPLPYDELINNKELHNQCFSRILEPLMLSFEEDDFKKILTSEDVIKEIKNRGYTHFIEDYRYLQKAKKLMLECDESLSPYEKHTELFATEYINLIDKSKGTGLYISGHRLILRLVNIEHKDNFGQINDSDDFVEKFKKLD